MATIAELKALIENANALGRQNLRDKGVNVEDTATTYEIMSKIADITAGEIETSLADRVYTNYGVSKDEYKYCIISFNTFSNALYVYFTNEVVYGANLQIHAPYLRGYFSGYSFSDFDNIESVLQYTFDKIKSLTLYDTSYANVTSSNTKSYINFDKGTFTGIVYNI